MKIALRFPMVMLLAAGSAVAAPAAPRRSVLPFVEDDYASALEKARSRHKPLFIEAWAPW